VRIVPSRGTLIATEHRFAGMTAPHTLPRSMWATLALLTLGWGLNWPMIKMALTGVPVWTFRALCVAAGAVGMFLIARLSGLRIAVPEGQWPGMLLTAFFNVTLWNIFIAYGVHLLPSGRSAILAYTMPLWVVLLSALFLHERITVRRLLGLTLGMGGMGLLIGGEFVGSRSSPAGALFVVSAALSWAVGTVLMKRFPISLPTTSFTAWQLLLGGAPIMVGALGVDWGTWRPLTLKPAIGLGYNMIVGFVICHWAWFQIAKGAPAGVASLSTLMIPVVGVFSGMLVLGERPGWEEYAALVLVILALATVVVPPRPVRR